MLDDILFILRTSIDSASSWFLQIINSLEGDWFGFIITMFTIFLVSRFILGPLFGRSWGSDSVRRARNESRANTEKRQAEVRHAMRQQESSHFGNYGGLD